MPGSNCPEVPGRLCELSVIPLSSLSLPSSMMGSYQAANPPPPGSASPPWPLTFPAAMSPSMSPVPVAASFRVPVTACYSLCHVSTSQRC